MNIELLVMTILQILRPFAEPIAKWFEKRVEKSKEKEKKKGMSERDKIRREKNELIAKFLKAKGEEQKKLLLEFIDRFGGTPKS